MKKMNQYQRLKAFTLQELMVVLLIIGILMMIALPLMDGLIGTAHSLEAQSQLKHLNSLQKTHYQQKLVYGDDFNKIRFEVPKTTDQGGDAKYTYEIVSASRTGYLARATAIGDFDGDEIINVWEIDQDERLREVTPD